MRPSSFGACGWSVLVPSSNRSHRTRSIETINRCFRHVSPFLRAKKVEIVDEGAERRNWPHSNLQSAAFAISSAESIQSDVERKFENPRNGAFLLRKAFFRLSSTQSLGGAMRSLESRSIDGYRFRRQWSGLPAIEACKASNFRQVTASRFDEMEFMLFF